MANTSSTPTKASRATLSFLRRAHSPKTANAIHVDKFLHKPLSLEPATGEDPPQTQDARARRRASRNAKLVAQGQRRRKKPQPLSAAEKRRLCVYDVPKGERKYSIYEGLHELWCKYMREILLGWPQGDAKPDSNGKDRRNRVEPQQAGAKLASADFHGARLQVVRSRCVSRVGVEGIVIKDTMFTFEVITKKDEIKTIPKEHTVFRFEVPLDSGSRADVQTLNNVEAAPKSLVFELHGDNFKNRAPDRANKKFKMHLAEDL